MPSKQKKGTITLLINYLNMSIKIKCNVCEESPVHTLPNPKSVSEGTELFCSSCSKWLATLEESYNHFDETFMEWSLESDQYYDEDKDTLHKNYPVEYII